MVDMTKFILVSESLPVVNDLQVLQVMVTDGNKQQKAMYRYKEWSLGIDPVVIGIIAWRYLTPGE
jgi:hypothetical protein